MTATIVEALTRDVRTGRFRGGDRLPSEQMLADELGVGRSALREAIRELIVRDVVEVRTGRGTFVRNDRDVSDSRAAVGADDLARLELLEVRRIVEPESAALAALRATDDDMRRLAYDVDRLSESIGGGFSPPEDLGFHLDVVRAAHNGSLARMGGSIMSFYERDRGLPTERDVFEHRKIFEAIRARDQEAARRCMIAHLPDDIVPAAMRRRTYPNDQSTL